ncbi:MAG: nucleotidyltransferase domain-containing protein [Cyanobacteria bacterium P01_A01_bin.116]
MQTLTTLSFSTTLETCKKLLVQHYGEKLKGVILFGSAARQEITAESDIDLLVLLAQPLDPVQELRTVVDVLYPVQLEASHWISAMPAAQDEFTAGSIQLYRNIQQEGIVI